MRRRSFYSQRFYFISLSLSSPRKKVRVARDLIILIVISSFSLLQAAPVRRLIQSEYFIKPRNFIHLKYILKATPRATPNANHFRDFVSQTRYIRFSHETADNGARTVVVINNEHRGYSCNRYTSALDGPYYC